MPDMGNPVAIKVFISHASVDKPWVIPFATRLRSRGVDAWLDLWEIQPGDSLIQRVYDEGLGKADTFIVVLSPASVQSRWVTEEINVATIRRIEEKCRIIPVILDECQVPVALSHLKWIKIEDKADYQGPFDSIESAIHGVTDKPPIGELPSFISERAVPGLSMQDSRVFKWMCEVVMNNGHFLVSFPRPCADFKHMGTGLMMLEVLDSCQILQDHGFFDLHLMVGGFDGQVTPYGFGVYCDAFVPGYPGLRRQTAALIQNEQVDDLNQLVEVLGYPKVVVRNVLDLMAQEGMISLLVHSDGATIGDVHARLRRYLAAEEFASNDSMLLSRYENSPPKDEE